MVVLGIVVSGIDITGPLAIVVIVLVAFAASELYRRGDLKIPEAVKGILGQDDADEEDDNKETISNEGDLDIKFLNEDTDTLYDFVDFEPEYVDPENMNRFDGTYNLDNGGKKLVPIDASSDQIEPRFNLELLKGKTLILRYSKKGKQGIKDKENEALRKELSEAILENTRLGGKLEQKSKDIDDQISEEQESRGRHRRSPYPQGNEFYKKPEHEKDDNDAGQSDFDD